MANLTSILGTDQISASRGTINTNYQNLNADIVTVNTSIASLRASILSDNDEPHANLSSNHTQSVAATTVAYPIYYENQDILDGIGHSSVLNASRIEILEAGAYLITLAAITDLTSGTNKKVNIWLAVNSSILANSNTITTIPNANAEVLVTIPIVNRFAAGDFFEFLWQADDTNAKLLATAAQANPTRPTCPSNIITVSKIGT